MRRTLLLLLSLTLLSVFGAEAINPQYQKFLGLKYRNPSLNFTPGQFQSITGKFNGKTTDTLTLFPYDGEWEDDEFVYDKWIIISKNGTVPSKIITSYWPELQAEGDLDRNGCEDWGVLVCGRNGAWCEYDIYTCYKGKVAELASAEWWQGNDEPVSIIARQGAKRGEVTLSEYGWNSQMTEIVKRTKTKKITKFLN